MRKRNATELPRSNTIVLSTPTVTELLPMVRFQARRIHGHLPSNVDINDLFSAGLVGLVEAFRRFDPTKNTRFGTYAQFRVRGAILDSLRALDWCPRHLRKQGRAAQEAIRKLSMRLSRVPTEDQIAEELKTSLIAYQHLRGDLENAEMGSLYPFCQDGSGEEFIYSPGRPQDDPLYLCLKGEIDIRLAGAVDKLPERERQAMTLYYYEKMTWKKIALTLGVSESRVSQIHNSAVIHLRTALSDLAPKGFFKTATSTDGAGKSSETTVSFPRAA